MRDQGQKKTVRAVISTMHIIALSLFLEVSRAIVRRHEKQGERQMKGSPIMDSNVNIKKRIIDCQYGMTAVNNKEEHASSSNAADLDWIVFCSLAFN